MKLEDYPTPETDAHILDTLNQGLMAEYVKRLNLMILHARKLEQRLRRAQDIANAAITGFEAAGMTNAAKITRELLAETHKQ